MSDILPKSMQRINPENSVESFKTIEDYIAYMRERVSFSFSNFLRATESSGVTNAALLLMIIETNNNVAQLTSRFNLLENDVSTNKKDIAGIRESITLLESSIAEMESKVSAMGNEIKSLGDRVTALEKKPEVTK